MARPGVIADTVDHSSAHRIEMDVAQQFQQILIGVDQHRVVALLEQVSRRMQLALDGARIGTCDSQHQTAERNLAHLKQQMDVVRSGNKREAWRRTVRSLRR